MTVTKRQMRMYKKRQFDLNTYEHLDHQIRELEGLIEKVREEYGLDTC
jgi:hypothetical protein